MKRLILWAACGVGAVVGLLLVVAAILPKTFQVDREVVIERSRSDVYNYMRNLRNQPKFSTWSMIDPEMKKTYRGTDGEVGSVYAWESPVENVGIGELEVTALRPDEQIILEIRFTKPFVAKNPSTITFASQGERATVVRQVYQGRIDFPMNLICGMVSAELGKGMEETLKNLKNVLEAEKAVPGEPKT